MNTRVLELLKKPELLAKEDLNIIEKEIQKMPFVQSIRALYLLGVYQFHSEVYQQELSKTAAYTTDKKILYFLINKDKKELVSVLDKKSEKAPAITVETTHQEIPNATTNPVVEEQDKMEDLPHFTHQPIEVEIQRPSPVTSNVEEGNIENEKNEVSKEPIVVTSNIDDKITPTESIEETSLILESSTEDTFIYYQKKSTQEEKISTEDSSEINFYQSDYQQKPISDNSNEITEQVPSYSAIDFYSKPQQNQIQKQEVINNDITTSEEPQQEKIQQEEESPIEQDEYIWKPMQIDGYLPKTELEIPTVENPQAEPTVSEINNLEETTIKNEEERPVLNVSFFNNELEKIEKEKSSTEKTEPKPTIPKEDSNVSSFINTWQNWLKISDNTSTAKPLIEKKALVIDKFIENSPKISPIKEESDFVVKEKKDDISHLMTETLAQLYVEQKLFSRAIKAYEILQEKFPEKQEHFKEEIDKIRNRS